jgi:serine/threonine protein kinase
MLASQAVSEYRLRIELTLLPELPFQDASLTSLFKKIQTASYKPPVVSDGAKGTTLILSLILLRSSILSMGLADLLAKILVVDPKRRLTIVEIKEHPWMYGNFMFLMKSHHWCV